MYGLTHRFVIRFDNVTPIGPSATVLVIDRDPVTLDLAAPRRRRPLPDHRRHQRRRGASP